MYSWDQDKIANTLLEGGCEWRFNLQGASQRGGAWRGIIKPIRRILRLLVLHKLLTYESLKKFLIEAEGTLNSRPLMKLVSDCQISHC